MTVTTHTMLLMLFKQLLEASEHTPEARKSAEKISSLLTGQSPSVMQEAEDIIYGDREKTYGDPSKNLARIAELWTHYLQKNVRAAIASYVDNYTVGPRLTDERLREITALVSAKITVTDVCRMMQSLKWARDENSPKRDNIVDDIGYAGLVHRCREPKWERSVPTGVVVERSDTDKEFILQTKTPVVTRKSKSRKSKSKGR